MLLLDAWLESGSSEALTLGLRKMTPSTRSTLYTKKIKGYKRFSANIGYVIKWCLYVFASRFRISRRIDYIFLDFFFTLAIYSTTSRILRGYPVTSIASTFSFFDQI